ncbi:type IV pilus assembly protein PilW [Alteromonadaceae bacterium Bs31]|nr:type IV pilus assembly protein PilW [Alteromonadaceae bacterium Bs31]
MRENIVKKTAVNGKRSKGLSLVELLVSMAVGSIILSGAVIVYIDQLESSKRIAAYSQMQESGRVALDMIESDIHMSGFTGCFSTNDELNVVLGNSAPSSFQPQRGIQGWEAKNTVSGETLANVKTTTALVKSSNGNWTSTAGNNLDSLDLIPNSDILRIWSGGTSEYPVTSIITGGSEPIVTVTGGEDIKKNSFLILSDCTNADVIQACAAEAAGTDKKIKLGSSCSPGNLSTASLKTKMSQSPSLSILRGTTYLVSKSNGITRNPPSLFRAELNTDGSIGDLQEVVEGVESMQIVYGENLDGDNLKSVDAYVTADKVSDWENVISVRVTLLVQSVNNNLSQGPVPYVFNGVNYSGVSGNPAPADNRLRRVFTRTFTLRNRTLGS